MLRSAKTTRPRPVSAYDWIVSTTLDSKLECRLSMQPLEQIFVEWCILGLLHQRPCLDSLCSLFCRWSSSSDLDAWYYRLHAIMLIPFGRLRDCNSSCSTFYIHAHQQYITKLSLSTDEDFSHNFHYNFRCSCRLQLEHNHQSIQRRSSDISTRCKVAGRLEDPRYVIVFSAWTWWPVRVKLKPNTFRNGTFPIRQAQGKLNYNPKTSINDWDS